MGYVGNQQAEGFVQRPTKQDLTGATGTSLTLSHAVSKEEDIDLYINNVKQEPTTAYTVADTAVTLTGSVVATDDIYVVYNSLALQTVTPPDGSVTSAKLASGAVTTAKLDTPIGIETTSSTFKMTDLTNNAFYRTGTWTPYYSSSGATTAYESDIFTSASYTNQTGTYTRIGDMVFAYANITLDYSAAGYQNGGAYGQGLSVSGLPFKAKNTNNYYPMTSTVYFSVDPAQGWGSYNLVGLLTFNEKYIRIRYSSGGGTVTDFSTAAVYDTVGGGATDSTVLFNIAYCTDDA